jgi:hypothetical protein
MKGRHSHSLRVIAVAIAIATVGALSSCAVTPRVPVGAKYLQSLEVAGTLDGRARAVCTKNEGTASKSSSPVELLVASNSTLAAVRRLEAPGYAVRYKDPVLLSDREGYAAVCLVKTKSDGKPFEYWEYELPNGEGDFIVSK